MDLDGSDVEDSEGTVSDTPRISINSALLGRLRHQHELVEPPEPRVNKALVLFKPLQLPTSGNIRTETRTEAPDGTVPVDTDNAPVSAQQYSETFVAHTGVVLMDVDEPMEIE